MSLTTSRALDAELHTIATRLRQSTVTLRDVAWRGRARQALGAGVAWESGGVIVTNAHVARRDRVEVESPDGRRAVARVVARDPRHDLAALDVDGALPLTPAAVADSGGLRVGELVLALGHPLGVPHALAVGVVQAAASTARRQIGDTTVPQVVRADVRLAPGNSGGALADVRGRVVGVNALVAGGLGVAIASERVRRFVAELAPRARLGVLVRHVRVRTPPRAAREAAAERGALLVLEVEVGSPADGAGVLAGDLLFAVDGRRVERGEELLEALRGVRGGAPLLLEIGRAGRRSTLSVAAIVSAPTSRAA